MTDLEKVGQAWLRVALFEHASVAAFARLVLQLMSLGAPPELLQAAIQAMAEEVEHARLGFGLARKFSGEAVGPGRMDVSGALSGSNDPAAILHAAIVEGCFEETISARCAGVALERAKDESVRTVLTRIVEEESRHAELSWKLVTWILQKFPELKPAAEESFAQALAAPEAEEAVEDSSFEDYGHLLASTRSAVREATIRDEITPRIVSLLGMHPRMRQFSPMT